MSAIILLTCFCISQAEPGVSQDLHERCLVELRDVLKNGKEFVKVHAAESLLWTGNPEGVREVFLGEPQTVPKYRIGVWRVLAQASLDKQERHVYDDKLMTVLLDHEDPERQHAA